MNPAASSSGWRCSAPFWSKQLRRGGFEPCDSQHSIRARTCESSPRNRAGAQTRRPGGHLRHLPHFRVRQGSSTVRPHRGEALEHQSALVPPLPNSDSKKTVRTRRQAAGGRRQAAGGRRQEAESRRQKAEGSNQEPATRNQEPETKNQKPATSNQQPVPSPQSSVPSPQSLRYGRG